MAYYSMAWNASRISANVFNRAIGFVLVPTFARLQDDPERIRRGTDECVRFSYLMLPPLAALLFACAPQLTELVLGSRWLPLVPCLRVMSVSILFTPLVATAAALLVGVPGRTIWSP